MSPRVDDRSDGEPHPVARGYMSAERAQVLEQVVMTARDVVRHWRPARDSEGDGIVGALMSGLRDLDALDIDSPCNVAERLADFDRRVITDTFRAGAEYMRRSTQMVREDVPYCGGAIPLPRLVMPDAERVNAAAAGYVEGLGR